eukprot:TRINITY_DN859_c0_g1_i1.p1 TRINITY_DN859_c0_g1~~TRINITY_DN859_c0_g1_i1.p1  ORF type:complete len:283 (-),score=29.10 TRINITY_DN859_c0_g1_i1:59-907(-)
MVGSKVSAVSTKSHTTRENTLGVLTINNTQLCFVDTPGIIDWNATNKSCRELGVSAWNSVFENDMIMVITDSVKTISTDKDFQYIVGKLEQMQLEHGDEMPPAVLVLNKIDLVEKIPEEQRKPIIGRFEKHYPNLSNTFERVFTVSALNGKKVLELQQFLMDQAKPSPWNFSAEVRTDQSDLQLCEEIIREKIFKRVNREVPYKVKLENNGWTILPNGTLRIDETILVPKLNHKRMVLGLKGSGIYGINEAATQELQSIFNRTIDLRLHVKVSKSGMVEDDV